VAHHYELIGGRSPLNELTFRQAEACGAPLGTLPVYVGMRNWAPYVADTVAAMTAAGVRRAVGSSSPPHANEASRERYVETVDAARAAEGPRAPSMVWAPDWHLHPGFVEALADRLTAACPRSLPCAGRVHGPSIPSDSAAQSPYVRELGETAAAVASAAGVSRWQLAYQSRSGNPRDPWLEPDVNDVLRALAADGARDVVVAPIGFVCDHVEVLYDLDLEARATADGPGMRLARAGTAGDHPAFVAALADTIRSAAT
jgi:ferrochelatase